MKTTILLIGLAHAADGEPAPATVNINDVATWLFLILIVGMLLWAWVRLWRWFDRDIRPLFVELQRRSAPSTLRPWVPDAQALPITVASARCEPGQTQVLRLDGDGVASAIRDVLSQDGAVVAVHAPLALPPDFARSAQGRVFISDDLPNPASMATLAAHGRPAVVLTRQSPGQDCADLTQKLGLIVIVIESQLDTPAAVGASPTETQP